MRLGYIATAVMFLAMTASGQWITQQINTTASFRGLSVVNEKVVWASGTGGTVINTADGGRTWKIVAVPGAEKLDFRDVEAFDAKTAYVLSIGNGESSRIYKTTDGGATWKLQFTNKNEKAFFDAIACWDAANCVAMSDPVDGRYILISTTDGQNWTQPGADKKVVTPPAVEGEAAFAASGTCLITSGANGLFLVSGGKEARVFSSSDRGSRWSVAETSFIKGTAGSGIFSIAMLDEKNGVMVGGNYEKPNDAGNNLAFTINGGWTWNLAEGLSGYRSGVAYIDEKTIIAVGTNGADISYDRGAVWRKMGTENLNAVAAKGKNAVWAVGPKGLVVKMR